MKQTVYLIINSLTLIFALVMNYLSGTGAFGGRTVGDVSALYENLFTPAGYAFGIWGLIYLLLISFAGYQWYAWFKNREDRDLRRSGYWFALANTANGLWIYAWLNLYVGVSVILMLILLFSLIMLSIRLRLELYDEPVRIIAFVWWPITIYLGWIIVATVANFAAFFVSIHWYGGVFPEQSWVIILILIAAIVYSLLIYYRNMREAAMVGIWAFIAIAVKQWDRNDAIVYVACIAAALLFIYSGYHGYKNKETSPMKKMKRGEV